MEEPKIICGFDTKLTEFKFTVNQPDGSAISLHACPDCNFWYEYPLEEDLKDGGE